jgi:hypothetical protein
MNMEDQIPSSIPPQMNQPIPGQITPEQLEAMKQQARELAIAQHMIQQQAKKEYPLEGSTPYMDDPKPLQKIIYVRRNLTVAELLLILCVATGIVTGVQVGWKFASENFPRIEIRLK